MSDSDELTTWVVGTISVIGTAALIGMYIYYRVAVARFDREYWEQKEREAKARPSANGTKEPEQHEKSNSSPASE